MKFRLAILAPLVTAILVLSATLASSFDLSGKPVGDIVHWRTDNGNTSVEFLGKTGRFYRLRFKRDNSKGAPLDLIFISRRDGQIVKAIYNGKWTKYSPHDCQLTMGKCRYTERLSDGRSRKMIQIASMNNGKISYKLYHTRISATTLVEKGVFTVDKFGYVIDRDYIQSDGQRRWSRRMRNSVPGS